VRRSRLNPHPQSSPRYGCAASRRVKLAGISPYLREYFDDDNFGEVAIA
jgi:hypothetical protein